MMRKAGNNVLKDQPMLAYSGHAYVMSCQLHLLVHFSEVCMLQCRCKMECMYMFVRVQCVHVCAQLWTQYLEYVCARSHVSQPLLAEHVPSAL